MSAKRKYLQSNARRQHSKWARAFDEERLRARVNDIGAACTTSQISAASRLHALAERVRGDEIDCLQNAAKGEANCATLSFIMLAPKPSVERFGDKPQMSAKADLGLIRSHGL